MNNNLVVVFRFLPGKIMIINKLLNTRKKEVSNKLNQFGGVEFEKRSDD